jgi:hypothetical protein
MIIAIMLVSMPAVAHAQDDANATKIFSVEGDDGIVVANNANWYFEEFDGRSRPVSGVLWKGGVITERTSWVYSDEVQQAVKKIVTDDAGSIISEFDASGNLIELTKLDDEGNVASSTKNEYDDENRIVLTVFESDGIINRTEITYEKGEQKTKRVYKNGEPIMTWISTGLNDWTESMYYQGQIILVVEYIDGVKKEQR